MTKGNNKRKYKTKNRYVRSTNKKNVNKTSKVENKNPQEFTEEKKVADVTKAIDELLDNSEISDTKEKVNVLIPAENHPLLVIDDKEEINDDKLNQEEKSNPITNDANEDFFGKTSIDVFDDKKESDVATNNEDAGFDVKDDKLNVSEDAYDDKTVILGDLTDDSYSKESDLKENFSSNNINYKNRPYLSYNTRLIINFVGIFVFVLLAIVLFASSISIKARSNMLYNQTSNLDYKVYLKENNYYSEPYLPKNMQYIASLIDSVDITFNYNFSANQSIDYKYTYYVKADIKVTSSEDESKVIYSKTDKLTEPETVVKENSSGFNVNQNIKINYSKYNDLVKAFKSSYAISADSNLVLSFLVDIEDEKGNKIKQEDKDPVKLTIPLSEQMIDISMDYNEVNNSNNVTVYKDFNISNKVTLVLSIISFIIALIFVVRQLVFIKKTSTKKTIYDVTLSKILREYDRVIVNSKKIIDLNDDVIDVNSFNELLDVRDNLEKPIIFQELHKGQKSVFIVKTPNETYRYILKLVDLQKEQEK